MKRFNDRSDKVILRLIALVTGRGFEILKALSLSGFKVQKTGITVYYCRPICS